MSLLHKIKLWNQFRKFSERDFIDFLHGNLSKKNKSEEELLRYIEATLHYIKFKMPKKPEKMEDIDTSKDTTSHDYWVFYVMLAEFYEHILHEFYRLAQLARDERAAENRMFNLNQHMVNLRRLIKGNGLELDMLGYYNRCLQETLVGLSRAKARIESDSIFKAELSKMPVPYQLGGKQRDAHIKKQRFRLIGAIQQNIAEWEAALEKINRTIDLFLRMDTDSYKKT